MMNVSPLSPEILGNPVGKQNARSTPTRLACDRESASRRTNPSDAGKSPEKKRQSLLSFPLNAGFVRVYSSLTTKVGDAVPEGSFGTRRNSTGRRERYWNDLRTDGGTTL
jgi:hypothetical protein